MRKLATDRAGLEILHLGDCFLLLRCVPLGRLGFVAGGEVVREMWNATARQAGPTMNALNADYNPQIAPGGSVVIGFNANSQRPGSEPSSFTLNGAQCSVE